jgi:hypothetical protein
MKTYFLGLALVAFVSAVAIQALHARTTTPPVFVVVEVDETSQKVNSPPLPAVSHDKADGLFFDRPRRREATFCHGDLSH